MDKEIPHHVKILIERLRKIFPTIEIELEHRKGPAFFVRVKLQGKNVNMWFFYDGFDGDECGLFYSSKNLDGYKMKNEELLSEILEYFSGSVSG